jgi:FAD:protein FMN transferase
MASTLRLTVTGSPRLGKTDAQAAWAAVSAEFDAVDMAMSRFRHDSAVTELNRLAGTGTATLVGPRLYAAIATSHRAQRRTGGRFDPRVLERLDELGYRGAALSGGKHGPAAARGGWLQRWPREHRVRIEQPIDLGGIGKGLALRWAWQRLAGVLTSDARPGCLLEAGGDVVVGGPSPGGGHWSIGIEDPRGRSDPIAVAAMSSGSLCTSSIRVNHWRDADGRNVHHLIDPFTGEPGGDGLLAVTVAGADPAWSEVWTKALFLAGRSGIADLARSRGLAAWWVDDAGDLSMTPAGRSMTVWP